MSRGGRGGGRGGFFHNERGGRGGGFNGRGGMSGGYEEWGKRAGEELDGPPSRMRKMDSSPDPLEENGRRPGDSNGASAAKTITDLAKRIDKVQLSPGLQILIVFNFYVDLDTGF